LSIFGVIDFTKTEIKNFEKLSYRRRFESVDKKFKYFYSKKLLLSSGLGPGSEIRVPEKLIPTSDPGVKKAPHGDNQHWYLLIIVLLS
jgi:hypothetical protein